MGCGFVQLLFFAGGQRVQVHVGILYQRARVMAIIVVLAGHCQVHSHVFVKALFDSKNLTIADGYHIYIL